MNGTGTAVRYSEASLTACLRRTQIKDDRRDNGRSLVPLIARSRAVPDVSDGAGTGS